MLRLKVDAGDCFKDILSTAKSEYPKFEHHSRTKWWKVWDPWSNSMDGQHLT